MKPTLLAALLRAALLGIVGLAPMACAPGRFNDLRDVAQLSFGAGKGLSVDASLGFLSQPSIGLYGAKTAAFGLAGRNAAGYIAETDVSAPYAFFFAREQGAGFFESLNFSGLRASYGVLALQRGFEEVDKPLLPTPPREFGRVIDGRSYGGGVRAGRWLPLPSAASDYSPWLKFNALSDLQVGGHIAIFAARVGVNPLELVDFLLGFVGLDIAGDDGARDYSALSMPAYRAVSSRPASSAEAGRASEAR